MPLGRRQPHVTLSADHPLCEQVDGEVVGLHQGRRGGARGLLDAADGGAQPGHQLVHAERLGDVVVGARVQRGDLLAGRLARRQDQDRHPAPAAQGTDHVDAVHVGQPQVQQHHVGLVRRRQAQGRGAVGGRVHAVPPYLHVDHEGPYELRVVLHHQHPGHGCTPFFTPAGAGRAG
jgi:hypothetical protein